MARITVRLPHMLGRFARDRRGVSAVEFALLAPLMILLYVGCSEISNGVAISRKVSLIAGTLSNLAASCSNSNSGAGGCTGNNFSTTDMSNMLDASSAIIAPYTAANLRMTLSCINIDANKVATVKWTATRNGGAGGTVSVPTALLQSPGQLLYSAVSYAFTPTVGYTVTGPLTLSDHMYMAPRINSPSYNGTACQ